ncbi:M35 family metallo-endopeptidase [Massilia sp. HP4]|uniref:M35 family metallo-endopeptidase n=1 Tax=Massilia sp. HP4 TaxID=2562316 RepID=UPI0010BFFCB3|nr:M35 family metallo-endopeptidase [Massilia sp. HP4]
MSLRPLLPRAALAAVVLSWSAIAAAAVDVTVAPEKPTVERGDDVMVRVTLTNSSSTAQHLLRWRTPLDGVESPLFEVRRDGQPVRYLGRRIKRAPPGPADYVRLDPGASLSKTVELSRLYEMSVTGSYTIRYRSPAMPAPGAGVQAVVGELVSSPVSIWVNGRLARGSKPAAMAPEPGGAGLSYANCSNAQQEQLATAMDAGRAMTVDSHAYLTAGKQYGERYTTWFGALDAARGARVTSNFTAIKDALESKPVKIDCDCDEPYFAYVYPARPYTVWVCRAFWAAAVTGTDSRGGTLLHELSHFDVVAATDDHVYGQAGAAELARSAPERAINNADSHEYFGENTPVQQ